MKYLVEWEPVWHRGLDFVLPGAGRGSRLCATRDDAHRFVEKLETDGIKLSATPGHEIFGSELKIIVTAERKRKART